MPEFTLYLNAISQFLICLFVCLFFAKGVISPLDIQVARVEGFVKCSLNNTYSSIKVTYFLRIGDHGSTVKVLCYKSEGCWFDIRLCHWNFSLT